MSVLSPKERFQQFEKIACDFQVDRNIPIKRYVRSGVEMLRMADTYFNEDNHGKAYILYHKFVTLFVQKLKLHPGFKQIPKTEMTLILKNVRSVMPRLEDLKRILTDQFEAEYAEWTEELERKRAEMARLETEMKKIKLEEEGRRLKEEQNKYHDEKERALAIARDREVAIWHQLQIDQELYDEENARNSNQETNSHQPQDLPAVSVPSVDRSSKPDPGRSPTSSVPAIPSRATKPSSSLYSSSGLRTVHVPTMLMAKFASLSDSNTAKNIETCGILAGKLAQNSFRITHLLIPKQTGTSDSCVTQGEESLFEYQDSHDLITLGWIHTHPSQTAFLSSVDLHTQLSYQLMMPEAIAIVMAPKFNETGFFVLTPNYGLDYIGNCRETGFHPHPKEPPLFEEGSHVQLDENADVILADLRQL